MSQLKSPLRYALFFILFSIPNITYSAQSFQCNFGTQPACLNYNDKVCSGNNRCVSGDAAVFDRYQCDFEGFTCKSNVTEMTNKYNTLINEYNSLLQRKKDLNYEYNLLLDQNNDVVDKHNNLLSKYEYALDEYETLESDHNRLKSCLLNSINLNEAQNCDN